jgi:hypothetical protein
VTPRARKAFGQMTDEQKGKLEALGFLFELPGELRGPPPVDWETAFAALEAYAAKHGELVGQWVSEGGGFGIRRFGGKGE